MDQIPKVKNFSYQNKSIQENIIKTGEQKTHYMQTQLKTERLKQKTKWETGENQWKSIYGEKKGLITEKKQENRDQRKQEQSRESMKYKSITEH